jgi:hypothetical protein
VLAEFLFVVLPPGGKPGAGNDRTDNVVFGIVGVLVILIAVGYFVARLWLRRRR